MSILLTIITALPQSPDGLRKGETYGELAPAPVAVAAQVIPNGDTLRLASVRGRVIDASTARPISNARIETWTEEIDATYGGLHRIGETRSRLDGQFDVVRRDGAEIAEKVRIAADGYLTWSGTMGDLYSPVVLFPVHEQLPAPQVRVVDSRGRPIAGARFTTTYSCAHDVPAFDLTTGVDGIARLVECGMQDHDLELRVRAPGFLAIKYLDWLDVWTRPVDAGPLEVALPRCAPFRMRILQTDGTAATHLPLYVLDGDSYHVVRTDADGIAHIASRYGDGAVVVHELADPANRFVAEFSPPPDGRVTTLRVGAEDWPADLDTGTVRVEWIGHDADAPRLEVQFAHEDGWLTRRPFEPSNSVLQLRLPVGRVTMTLGGAFEGAAPKLHELDVRADELATIALEIEVEPTLRVLAPDDRYLGAWLEAGATSREGCPLDAPIRVPRGMPLTIALRERGGRLHLHDIAPLTADTVLDLRERLAGEPATDGSREAIEQRVSIVAVPGGSPLADVTLSLRSDDTDAAIQLADDGRSHVFAGRVGTPWMLRCSAPGHASTWHRGVFGAGDRTPLECVMPEFAKLRLTASFEFRLLEGEDSAIDLDELTPGPLQLCVERADGRCFGLCLIIEAGETRVLTLPG